MERDMLQANNPPAAMGTYRTAIDLFIPCRGRVVRAERHAEAGQPPGYFSR